MAQDLAKQGYKAEAVQLSGGDKRERLSLTTQYIKNSNILFPRNGCKELIGQLTGFGYEKRDDLADAFSLLILRIMRSNIEPAVITGGIL